MPHLGENGLILKQLNLHERRCAVMPDFPIDESEDILQQDESAEPDDIPEMEEEDE